MLFGEPLRLTVPTHLLAGQPDETRVASILIDDTRDPYIEFEDVSESTIRLAVPHFSGQAIFDWSSLDENERQGLMGWVGGLYDHPPHIVSFASPDFVGNFGRHDSCNHNVGPLISGDQIAGHPNVARLHGRHGRKITQSIDGIKIDPME